MFANAAEKRPARTGFGWPAEKRFVWIAIRHTIDLTYENGAGRGMRPALRTAGKRRNRRNFLKDLWQGRNLRLLRQITYVNAPATEMRPALAFYYIL